MGTGSVLAIVALGVAVWEWRTTEKIKAAVAEVGERRIELSVRLRNAHEQRAQADKSVLAAKGATDRGVVNGDIVSSREPASPGKRSQEQMREKLERDPGLQNRLMAWQRAELMETYGSFFRMMRLLPEQSGRLGDAWAQHVAAGMDLSTIMKEKKLPANDPVIAAQRARGDAELRATEEAVLGAEGYEKLVHYKRTQPMRELVARLARKAALAGSPINAEQAEQLVEVLAESDAGFRSGGEPSSGKVNWEAASEAARSILAPAQYEVFMKEGEAAKAASVFSHTFTSAWQVETARSRKADAAR